MTDWRTLELLRNVSSLIEKYGEMLVEEYKVANKNFIKSDVMRSVCCNEELIKFKTYGYDECVGCGKTYKHTDA